MPVSRQAIQAIVEGLERLGVEVGRLGVPRIEDDQALALLWERAIARSGRRSLPLEVGLAMPLGAMGVVDYLAAASATVGAALVVTQQVFPLVGPGLQLSLERVRGRHRVAVVNQPPFPGQVESDLLVVGILLGRLRRLAARPPELPLVELTAPHGSRTRWAELLGTPRLRLGRPRAALVLTGADWALPMRHADPRLLTTLWATVSSQRRSPDALLVAVRALGRARQPVPLGLEEAAGALGLSRRTLQRRLARSGTTLERLNDELRRELAEELVEAGLLTLGEVAARAGFAEQASFTRAWRRWFGGPPSARRQG